MKSLRVPQSGTSDFSKIKNASPGMKTKPSKDEFTVFQKPINPEIVRLDGITES